MKSDTAKLLSTDGLGEMTSTYSGRGMNGETTHAVVFEHRCDYEGALLNAAFDLGARASLGTLDVEEILSDLRNLGTDSMGMGIVVY
jgi:hypothetical protein